MPAVRAYLPRIVLAFDFDRTLATHSVDAVLRIYGAGREAWGRDFEAALGEGWDDITRRGRALIDLDRARAGRSTWTCCARPPRACGSTTG